MDKKTSCGGLKIADNPSVLPAVTSADTGRVLMVDASRKWVVGSLT